METKQTTAIQSKAKYEGDKDDWFDKEWEFHVLMQGVNKQCIAQYGEDSNQIQALGLKKKSEYKKRIAKRTPSNKT